METPIRPLTPGDAPIYREVRSRALREHPEAFGASLAEHEALPLAEIERRLAGTGGSATFGAFEDGRLVGICSLFRHVRDKTGHACSVFGMYVAPPSRGRGVGRELLQAALRHARTLPGVAVVRISVNPAARAARRLYVSTGFAPWGVEPDSFRVDGRPQAEEHMQLELDASVAGDTPSA